MSLIERLVKYIPTSVTDFLEENGWHIIAVGSFSFLAWSYLRKSPTVSQSANVALDEHKIDRHALAAQAVAGSSRRSVLPVASSASLALSPNVPISPADRRCLSEKLQADVTAAFGSHPALFGGPLSGAFQASKSTGKLLVIYLHPPRTQEMSYIKEMIFSEFVADYLNINFITWVGVGDAPETAQICQQLNVANGQGRSYPFITILSPKGGQSNFTSLIRIQEQINSELFVERLMAALEFGDEEERKKAELSSSRSISVMQDVEYQNAVQQDLLLKLQREKEETERKNEEQVLAALEAEVQRNEVLAKEAQRKEEETKQKEEEEKKAKAVMLGAEPQQGDGVCTIGLRLPNGLRVKRLFLMESALNLIHFWCETLEMKNMAGGFVKKFRLINSVTKKAYASSDVSPIQSIGGKQVLLLVEEADED